MFRTYRVEEIGAIVAELQSPGYAWWVEEIPVKGAPLPITAVLGRPGAGS